MCVNGRIRACRLFTADLTGTRHNLIGQNLLLATTTTWHVRTACSGEILIFAKAFDFYTFHECILADWSEPENVQVTWTFIAWLISWYLPWFGQFQGHFNSLPWTCSTDSVEHLDQQFQLTSHTTLHMMCHCGQLQVLIWTKWAADLDLAWVGLRTALQL